MQDPDPATANAVDATDDSEPDVPADAAEPFEDDPPPPFSDPPSEATEVDPGPDPDA